MPYRLRKAPKRELYWVVAEDGTKKSKDPLPHARAVAQMKALYASMKKEGAGKCYSKPDSVDVPSMTIRNPIQKALDNMDLPQTNRGELKAELERQQKKADDAMAAYEKSRKTDVDRKAVYDKIQVYIRPKNKSELSDWDREMEMFIGTDFGAGRRGAGDYDPTGVANDENPFGARDTDRIPQGDIKLSDEFKRLPNFDKFGVVTDDFLQGIIQQSKDYINNTHDPLTPEEKTVQYLNIGQAKVFMKQRKALEEKIRKEKEEEEAEEEEAFAPRFTSKLSIPTFKTTEDEEKRAKGHSHRGGMMKSPYATKEVEKMMADREKRHKELRDEMNRRAEENASWRVVDESPDFKSELEREIKPAETHPMMKNKATLHHAEMRMRGLAEKKPQELPRVEEDGEGEGAIEFIDRRNLILHAISQPRDGKSRSTESLRENIRLLREREGDDILYFVPELEDELTAKEISRLVAESDAQVQEPAEMNKLYKDYIPSAKYKGVVNGEGMHGGMRHRLAISGAQRLGVAPEFYEAEMARLRAADEAKKRLIAQQRVVRIRELRAKTLARKPLATIEEEIDEEDRKKQLEMQRAVRDKNVQILKQMVKRAEESHDKRKVKKLEAEIRKEYSKDDLREEIKKAHQRGYAQKKTPIDLKTPDTFTYARSYWGEIEPKKFEPTDFLEEGNNIVYPVIGAPHKIANQRDPRQTERMESKYYNPANLLEMKGLKRHNESQFAKSRTEEKAFQQIPRDFEDLDEKNLLLSALVTPRRGTEMNQSIINDRLRVMRQNDIKFIKDHPEDLEMYRSIDIILPFLSRDPSLERLIAEKKRSDANIEGAQRVDPNYNPSTAYKGYVYGHGHSRRVCNVNLTGSGFVRFGSTSYFGE